MSNVPLDPVVEMMIDGTYVDITDDVRLADADSGGGITIVRGKPNEGNSAEPTQVDFTLNNIDGKYSPKNPNSENYGKIGRNQPIRIGLDRRTDNFDNRTAVDSWGSLPDRVDRELKTIPGEAWNLTGTTGNFDISAGVATLQSGSGTSVASFGDYGDCEVVAKIKMSDRTSETGIVFRYQSVMRTEADGTFESGIGDWTAVGGTSTLVSSTAQVWTGTKSALLTVAGSPATATIKPIASKRSPCRAGSSYRARTRLRCSFTGNAAMSFDWYAADGTFISTSTSGALGVTANTWTWFEYTTTAPIGAAYVGAGPILTGSPANGTTMFVDDNVLLDFSALTWYSAFIAPNTAPTADRLQIGKVVSGPGTKPGTVNVAYGADWSGGNYVVGTWYWIKAQAYGHRFRVKFWQDGTDEPRDWGLTNYDNRTDEAAGPTHGAVGIYAASGTCLLSVDSFQVTDWRAHAEITQLPPRWDMSHTDRWVPVSARGVLRRYRQGQKAELSAVRRHLQRYTPQALWFPLEENTGDSASNEVSGGLPATVKDLDFGQPDLSGTNAMPGLSGFAHFSKATSFLSGQAVDYTPVANSAWTMLFFFRIPANPTVALTSWFSVSTTGTARTFRFQMNTTRSILIQALDNQGTVLSSDTAVPYVAYPGDGWLAATLYVNNDPGSPGNVDWAFNYHQPGDSNFYTANGTYAGTAGKFRAVFIRSSTEVETAGGFMVSQLFVYGGDLPFVTDTFARAAVAYQGEAAGTRWNRLTTDAGILATFMGGDMDSTQPMSPQLPKAVMDLLEECATAEDGFISEERDGFAIQIHSMQGLQNNEVLELDEGDLSPPLEPIEDDQQTRNDITVTRPNGGFRRSVQETGPLNTQDPGTDADSVGQYDTSVEMPLRDDDLLQAPADFFRARGTLDEARYPSMVADLTSTPYMESRALTVRARSMDAGRIIMLTNPEVSPDPAPQGVQSYTERIDQYDHTLTWVTAPGRLYLVGVTGSSADITRYRDEARVQPAGIVTASSFVSGTDRVMSVQRAASDNGLWYPTADDPKVADFEILVSGVRLKLRHVGQDLATNGDFETGTLTGTWEASSGSFTTYIDTNGPYAGSYCCRCLASGAATGGPVQTQAASATTVAATSYAIFGWIKTEAAATDVRLAVDWYQSNGTTFISSSLPTPITTLANTWTWYSAVVTSPALGVRARLKARNVFAGATNMWVDDLRLVPVSSYNTEPQSITVDRVPANGIIKTIPAGERLTLAKPARVAPW